MPPPPLLIFSAYTLASLLTFLLFLLDKRAALHNRRRTPEKTLHLLSLLFGIPGAILAILILHHKNRKPSFYLITTLIAAAHLGVWLFVASR
jgi:uncharacterized membrane protein YsdA (DUF1294 family)